MPLSAVPYTYNNHACSHYHPWSDGLSDWKHNHQTFQQHYSFVRHPSQAPAAIKHKVTCNLWASDQESTGWLYVGMSSRRPKERRGQNRKQSGACQHIFVVYYQSYPYYKHTDPDEKFDPPPALTPFKNHDNIDLFRLWFPLLHIPAALLQW